MNEHIGATWQIRLIQLCAGAMSGSTTGGVVTRPVPKLLWPILFKLELPERIPPSFTFAREGLNQPNAALLKHDGVAANTQNHNNDFPLHLLRVIQPRCCMHSLCRDVKRHVQ